MLELANPRAGKTLYDLGSGHRRVLVMTVKAFGEKTVGIDAVFMGYAWFLYLLIRQTGSQCALARNN